MQTKKSQLSGHRIMRKLGKPGYQHYQFTLRLRYLGLHRRPMLDFVLLSVSYKEHATNKDIRRNIPATIGEYNSFLTIVKKRKLRWDGHI